MNIALLLEMTAEGAGDRAAVGPLTYAELLRQARNVGRWLPTLDGNHAALLDGNSAAVPLLLFGAALAGRPFAPVSYRLGPDQLTAVLGRLAPCVLVAGPATVVPEPLPSGLVVRSRQQLLAAAESTALGPAAPANTAGPEDAAVLLFTSGTTGEPKAAVLRHRQLAAYIIGSVEFLTAGPDEAALISVPPYHIAGISAILSSVYAGRRIVQLDAFDPEAWTRLANDEHVSHAMVVPTMLRRIVDHLIATGQRVPALRHLSYGGGRMPAQTIERAMDLLPQVDFVNAYGLTETSSTIALLGPAEHRRFAAGADPSVRRRLGSVGRPLPGVQIEVRRPDGTPAAVGESAEVFVRGDQVAGEYLDGSRRDSAGWFATSDAGHLDDEGYLFLDGRLDDVIVRGGENLSPGEIEDVLLTHPAVREVAVVGLPDPEWGEQIAAVVVLADGATADASAVQGWVRDRLRSSRTPSRVEFVSALPYTESGKVLRRLLRARLNSQPSVSGSR